MRRKLIIDGNAVYEIDDDCIRCKEIRQEQISVQNKTREHIFADVSRKDERMVRRETCVSESGKRKDIHPCNEE